MCAWSTHNLTDCPDNPVASQIVYRVWHKANSIRTLQNPQLRGVQAVCVPRHAPTTGGMEFTALRRPLRALHRTTRECGGPQTLNTAALVALGAWCINRRLVCVCVCVSNVGPLQVP